MKQERWAVEVKEVWVKDSMAEAVKFEVRPKKEHLVS